MDGKFSVSATELEKYESSWKHSLKRDINFGILEQCWPENN